MIRERESALASGPLIKSPGGVKDVEALLL